MSHDRYPTAKLLECNGCHRSMWFALVREENWTGSPLFYVCTSTRRNPKQGRDGCGRRIDFDDDHDRSGIA